MYISKCIPGEFPSHGPGYTHNHKTVGASLQVTFHTGRGDSLGIWNTVWNPEEEYFGNVQKFLQYALGEHGGLTLTGCQVPDKAALSPPSSTRKRLTGQDKHRDRSRSDNCHE